MNIKNRVSKSIFTLLLCLIMLISTANTSVVYALGKETSTSQGNEPPPGENPVIRIAYDENVTLKEFNFSFIEEGLIISFMNDSKDTETVNILVYVNTSGIAGLTGLILETDNGTQIKNVALNLCDDSFSVISNYKTFETNGSNVEISLDGEDLASQANKTGAYCIGFTVSISNWSPNTVHKLTLRPKLPSTEPGEKPPSGKPIISVNYSNVKQLDSFNWSFSGYDLIVSFMNQSKESETIDIVVYIEIYGLGNLSGLDLRINNNASIDRVRIDFCDGNFTFLSSYGLFNIGNNTANINIDGYNLTQQAKNSSAYCAKFTVTISHWSSNVMYNLTIRSEFQGGTSVYVLYDAQGRLLDAFNVSSTKDGMDISFSNASVGTPTIDILIYAGIEAIQYISGLNATIDKGAKIVNGSIDLCTNNLTLIKNYQTFNLSGGVAVYPLHFDTENLIGAVKNASASFVRFRITIGGWNSSTLYILRIQPFFKEILYYEKDGTVYVDPSTLKLPPELRVWWQRYNNTQSYNWTYQDISWEFGPRAHYEIFCYNVSSGIWYEVTRDTWVMLNSALKINVTVPKLLFEKGTKLGRVELRWNMWATNISAQLTISYDANSYIQNYSKSESRWHSYSYIWNYSKSDSQKGGTAEFFVLDENRTNIIETSDYYNIAITGQFNDLTPKGIYNVDLGLYDNRSSYIRGSMYYWSSEMSTYKQVAMGGPWSEVAAYIDKMIGGTYTASLMNTNHELIHSVGLNETFIIKVDITGILDSELANVSVVFPLPWGMKSYVNVTGWHEEYRIYHGGWVYDKTLKNYMWDPNATIITREWIYGSYMEERWVDWSSYRKEINVTMWEWNASNSQYRQYNRTEYVQPKVLLLYNNLNGSFGFYLAYEYYNATLMRDERGRQWVNYKRFLEIEEAPPELTFYQLLNVTKRVEKDRVSIEFEGRFTKKLSADLWLNYQVFSLKKEIWPKDWQRMEKNARFLSLEKAVMNVRIISDREVFGDCVTEPGRWLVVEAKTEGSSNLRTDVDGIRIILRYNNYRWSENETIWSNLEIIVTVNLRENTYTTVVYNTTSKNVYEYGTYNMWNATTGRTEEVETWHWEYYMLNQTSGKWVKGGLPWRSDDTLVNETYVTVNDFEAFTANDGRYIVQVNMSFTERADNSLYYYDVMLLNWTYGPDYSKPWREYMSEDWAYTTVYTVRNGSMQVYVPKPENKRYVEDLKGAKYLVFSKPYIKINGEKLPLKEIKYWNGYRYEYRLLQQEWDYTTGQQRYYYILDNNTRIYVFEAYNAAIYNATLPNGTSILTGMEYLGWNRFNNKRYLIALNGEIIWLEGSIYSLNVSQIDKVPVEFAGYFVLINGTTWENVTKGWVEWDWKVGQNYIEFKNLTRLYLKYDDARMYSWYFEKEGKRHYIDYPVEAYSGNYSGSKIVVPRWYKRTWYYTLVNEERVEVPYGGASSEYKWLSWWNLGQTKSEGGSVPEDDYVVVNGSLHLVNYYEGSTQQGNIVLDGKIVNVTKGTGLYTFVLGNDVWNVTQIGFALFLANLTDRGIYDMEHLIEMHVANPGYYYSLDNATLTLLNDTSLTTQKRVRVMFYELKLNETVYYVANYKPFYNYTTGTSIFYLLNGSKIEIPKSEKYEIVKTIIKDIGVYQQQIPMNFTWQGGIYNTTLKVDSMTQVYLWYTYYCADVNGRRYDIVPLSVLEKTFTPWGTMVPREQYIDTYTYGREFAIYNVRLNNGTTYTLYPRLDHVRVVRPTWGYPFEWHLQEFPWESISIRKQSYNIIVGAPEWGLWGYRSFKIVPETGALDLDGNLDTTGDQFYVRRIYSGEYSYIETRGGLNVHAVYDPNPAIPYDELIVNAWTGISRNTYRNTWNETYAWYYTNMTPVSSATMSLINETVWSKDGKTPKPGYWDISRMTVNMTWADYLRKAEKEGWQWVREEVSWTWLWFGFEQSYWASKAEDNGTFQSYYVRLRYEYAGMFIYNDTNRDSMMGKGEETHYFMPEAISNVTFITPGVALGNYNDTGMLVLPTNRSLEFGVSYLGVNGTMFPSGRSYYAWYGGNVSGTDLRTFTERPVGARLEELSFKIHFYVENSTQTNSTEAHVKIDQHIGDWTLDVPSNIAVLENLSLSLNYYVYAEMGGSWSVTSKNGSSINPNDIIEASKISLDSGGLKFADINMGDTYIWGGNLTKPYNVSSYTVPLNTFISTYASYGSNTSVGGWTFHSTMYFLSVGFPTWSGRYVYEDPEVVVYLGSGKLTLVGSPKELLPSWNLRVIQPEGGEQPGQPSDQPGGGEQLGLDLTQILLIAVAVMVVVVAIVSTVYLRKRRPV